MGLDIRLPMGVMFAILGGLLALYGIFTAGGKMYADHSLGININLWWGLCMLVFGLILAHFGRRAMSRPPDGPESAGEWKPR